MSTRRGETFGFWQAEKVAAVVAVGNTNLFTVTGTIKLLNIRGEVTTAISDSAVSIILNSVPTVGASSAIAGIVSARNDGLGIQYTITGTVATAMATTVAAGLYQATPLIIPAGTIKLQSTATPAAGAIKWIAEYVPLAVGARMTGQ